MIKKFKEEICMLAAMGVIMSRIPLSANAASVSETPIATSPTGSVQVWKSPSSGKDIAEGKSVH